MIDPEFVKWFTTLGIGGILAAFMFVFYRKDVQMYTELWKSTSLMLMEVIKDNTASNVELISMLRTQERNHLRKEDIEELIDRRINHGMNHGK
jgi:5-methylthioribose kinase